MSFHVRWCLLVVALAATMPLYAQSGSLAELLTGADDKAKVETDRAIQTETSTADDEKIRRRLSSIFSELDELEQISVAVSNSVVTLRGQAGSLKAIDRAGALARQVDGVVDVENHVT